jgi:hypothetical protein
VLDFAWQLGRHHLEQWAMEDECRDQAGDDRAVAAAKRAIDRLNCARIDLIQGIDAWAANCLLSPSSATPHTETLGSTIDRLAVAWVRSRRLEDRLDTPAKRNDHEVRSRAAMQLMELACAYDHLIREVQIGMRRLPNWLPLKRYGSRS